MGRDRDDNFELPALKRRRKSLPLNRERFGHASTEEASMCSRVVPKNTEKNDCWALDFERPSALISTTIYLIIYRHKQVCLALSCVSTMFQAFNVKLSKKPIVGCSCAGGNYDWNPLVLWRVYVIKRRAVQLLFIGCALRITARLSLQYKSYCRVNN